MEEQSDSQGTGSGRQPDDEAAANDVIGSDPGSRREPGLD